MKGYIYRYTFPDGKIYIGQTRRPIEMRHAEHINPSTGPMNPGFWDAYQKLGMPELTVLETVEADNIDMLVQILNHKETAYIQKEHATDPQYGYNRMGHSMVYRPEAKILQKEYEKLCRQMIEEERPFLDRAADKYLHGREADMTEEEKAFVKGYIETDNPFAGVADFEEMPDENPFQGDEEDFFKFEAVDYAIWLYLDETSEIIARYVAENADAILRKAREGKIIQQIDKEGNVVREFLTWDEIREAMNILRIDNILNVVKGRQKSAYGYFWRYKPVEIASE